jgi:hypothetical protein
MRELLQPHAEELVAKAVEMAKAGDAAALRMCLDRLIPPVKARDEPAELPQLTGTLAEMGELVINAMAEQRLTPDEGATILQALQSQVRIVEAVEIEKRIAALESAANKSSERV